MKTVKIVAGIAKNTLIKSITSIKLGVVVFVLATIIHQYMFGLTSLAASLEQPIHVFIYPFLFEWNYTKLLLMLLLLFLFADAPFIDETQTYVLIRSGKVKWGLGQLLYIFILSAFYFALVLILTVVLLLPNISFENEWGEAIVLLSKSNIGGAFGTRLFFPRKIIDYFTPYQAIGFSYLLTWLTGSLLGCLTFVINYITRKPIVGAFTAGIFLVLDMVIKSRGFLTWFSPASWGTLTTLKIGATDGFITFNSALTLYAIILGFLIVTANLLFLKQEVPTFKEL